MKINIFYWDATSTEKAVLDKLLSSAFKDVELNIVSLKSSLAVEPSNEPCLCFGSRAKNLIKHSHPAAIELPTLSELLPLQINETKRRETWDFLSKFSVSSGSNKNLLLTPEDFTDNLNKQIDNIKIITKDSFYIVTLKSGDKIGIANSRDIITQSIDFFMTVDELVALQSLSLLGFQQIEIMRKT